MYEKVGHIAINEDIFNSNSSRMAIPSLPYKCSAGLQVGLGKTNQIFAGALH